jgi:hypothetical protein
LIQYQKLIHIDFQRQPLQSLHRLWLKFQHYLIFQLFRLFHHQPCYFVRLKLKNQSLLLRLIRQLFQQFQQHLRLRLFHSFPQLHQIQL